MTVQFAIGFAHLEEVPEIIPRSDLLEFELLFQEEHIFQFHSDISEYLNGKTVIIPHSYTIICLIAFILSPESCLEADNLYI